MFERTYARPKAGWRRTMPTGSTLVSVAIHVGALAALAASGASPVDVARTITEGIVFLAPPPEPAPSGAASAEQLTFAELARPGADVPEIAEAVVVPEALAPPVARRDASAFRQSLAVLAQVTERRIDSVYLADQVDSPVAYDPRSAAPVYPDSLQKAGVEGSVIARFVVDTLGRVETGTFVLLESTHTRFTQSVREALPRMLFRPALLKGEKARQLVEIPFRFRVIVTKDTASRDTVSGPRGGGQ
jgi:TonB family protein